MTAHEVVQYIEELRRTLPDRRKPPDRRRRAQFRRGWQQAYSGLTYGSKALSALTWNNLGFRIADRFGATEDWEFAYETAAGMES